MKCEAISSQKDTYFYLSEKGNGAKRKHEESEEDEKGDISEGDQSRSETRLEPSKGDITIERKRRMHLRKGK